AVVVLTSVAGSGHIRPHCRSPSHSCRNVTLIAVIGRPAGCPSDLRGVATSGARALSAAVDVRVEDGRRWGRVTVFGCSDTHGKVPTDVGVGGTEPDVLARRCGTHPAVFPAGAAVGPPQCMSGFDDLPQQRRAVLNDAAGAVRSG